MFFHSRARVPPAGGYIETALYKKRLSGQSNFSAAVRNYHPFAFFQTSFF
jgi:hypothetical protein